LQAACPSSALRDRAEIFADFALRVFKRDELLQIIECAACQPPGRLQELVQYLAAKFGQDEALAQLTDAVLAALRRRLEN
jgi:hypothetical protein